MTINYANLKSSVCPDLDEYEELVGLFPQVVNHPKTLALRREVQQRERACNQVVCDLEGLHFQNDWQVLQVSKKMKNNFTIKPVANTFCLIYFNVSTRNNVYVVINCWPHSLAEDGVWKSILPEVCLVRFHLAVGAWRSRSSSGSRRSRTPRSSRQTPQAQPFCNFSNKQSIFNP